jgi:hypothetical protein
MSLYDGIPSTRTLDVQIPHIVSMRLDEPAAGGYHVAHTVGPYLLLAACYPVEGRLAEEVVGKLRG